MKKNTKHWLGGLISAASGGMSAPFGAVVADQITGQAHQYDLSTMLGMMVGPTLITVLAYLRQKPLPDDEEEPK